MKFKIFLTPNKRVVPFNYAHKLCGAFHRWVGPNELHDMLSLYSLGWLQGDAKVSKQGLNFPHGAYWDIGIHNSEIAERLIRGLLLTDVPVCYGMAVRKVERLKPPAFNAASHHRFLAGSPVLLRKVEDDRSRTHVTYENARASAQILTRLLHKKIEEAQLDIDPAQVKATFDASFPNPKTKLVEIKGIKNRASVCPVIVEGPPGVQEFAWTVGAGELTGVGFGSLNHTAQLDRNGS